MTDAAPYGVSWLVRPNGIISTNYFLQSLSSEHDRVVLPVSQHVLCPAVAGTQYQSILGDLHTNFYRVFIFP